LSASSACPTDCEGRDRTRVAGPVSIKNSPLSRALLTNHSPALATPEHETKTRSLLLTHWVPLADRQHPPFHPPPPIHPFTTTISPRYPLHPPPPPLSSHHSNWLTSSITHRGFVANASLFLHRVLLNWRGAHRTHKTHGPLRSATVDVDSRHNPTLPHPLCTRSFTIIALRASVFRCRVSKPRKKPSSSSIWWQTARRQRRLPIAAGSSTAKQGLGPANLTFFFPPLIIISNSLPWQPCSVPRRELQPLLHRRSSRYPVRTPCRPMTVRGPPASRSGTPCPLCTCRCRPTTPIW